MFHASNDRYMCPNCHTAEYIREDIDGHHCAMCGIVVCEDVYRNDQSFDPTTHRVQGTFIRAASTHCKTARRATAETRIRNLAERLRLDKSYEYEMMQYMNVLFANEATERIWNQGRYGEMVIGVLAFIVCRSKGVAITFQDICDGLSARDKINEYELSRVYYRIATVLNTDSPKTVTPSSWIKRAIFKLYSEGACVDDGVEESDNMFDDDDDDGPFNDSDIKSLYPSYYITSDSHKSALSRKGTNENGDGGAKKLKLRVDEKPQITVMATRILQVASKQWIMVGKKPMPVVAAAIVLAIEYYHGADDILVEVSERLSAAKTTVNKRCSEILQQFSALLKEMGFKNVRNRKDIVKHIPLALMYFDVIDSNEAGASSSSSSSSSRSQATKEDPTTKKASEVSRHMLPASFVKNERMRQERRVLIEQCKRLNQAILDGAPFPEDIPVTDEAMLIGTLLFEGVPEDVIANCPLETLKNLKTTGVNTNFVPLSNAPPSRSVSPAKSMAVPRRRVLKRYEKKKRTHASSHAPTSDDLLPELLALGWNGDVDDNEEEIGDFSWDSEVANCLREENDRKLVDKVVEKREKQAAEERAKLREENAEMDGGLGVDENGRPLSGQPKRKMAKVDKKLSTKINRQRLNEFLTNEKQKMFEDTIHVGVEYGAGSEKDILANVIDDPSALDPKNDGQQNKEQQQQQQQQSGISDSSNGGDAKQRQGKERQLLTRSTDSVAGPEDEGEENDYDYDFYSNDIYTMDEDLDIHF